MISIPQTTRRLTHELSSRHRRSAMILVLDEGESAILRLICDARVDDRVDDAVRESTHLVKYVCLGDFLRYAADEKSTVVDGYAYAQGSTAAYVVVVRARARIVSPPLATRRRRRRSRDYSHRNPSLDAARRVVPSFGARERVRLRRDLAGIFPMNTSQPRGGGSSGGQSGGGPKRRWPFVCVIMQPVFSISSTSLRSFGAPLTLSGRGSPFR